MKVYLLIEQTNIDCEGYYGPAIQNVDVEAFETKADAKAALKERARGIRDENENFEDEGLSGDGFFSSDPDSDDFISLEITEQTVSPKKAKPKKKPKEEWDGKCPYCGSEDVDFVDSQGGGEKYRCCGCGEDFITWDDGSVTDRHNRDIPKMKKGGK